MIEIRLIRGSWQIDGTACKKGDLLPTIAGMMQKFEAEHGELKPGQKYAIEFWPAQ